MDDRTAGAFLGWILSTFALLAVAIGETYATWDFIHTVRGGREQ